MAMMCPNELECPWYSKCFALIGVRCRAVVTCARRYLADQKPKPLTKIRFPAMGSYPWATGEEWLEQAVRPSLREWSQSHKREVFARIVPADGYREVSKM
jgi:hypothetical protein